jgi:hypothetical protein
MDSRLDCVDGDLKLDGSMSATIQLLVTLSRLLAGSQ